MKFLKVWLGPRLASSISYLSWASWAGPFLKNAELSWAGPDLKNPDLSWAHQLSSASSAHQIYNSDSSSSSGSKISLKKSSEIHLTISWLRNLLGNLLHFLVGLFSSLIFTVLFLNKPRKRYHPMESTPGHFLGFTNGCLCFLQSSMIYTRMHVVRINPKCLGLFFAFPKIPTAIWTDLKFENIPF